MSRLIYMPKPNSEAPPALLHFNSIEPIIPDTQNKYGTFVSNPYSLAEWNAFFNLPTNGPEFTSVSVVGNTVDLVGPGGIHLADYLFYVDTGTNPGWKTKLTKVDDRLGMFTSAGEDCFGYATIGNGINLPALTTAGDYCFEFAGGQTINLPSLTTYGNGCFDIGVAENYRFDSLISLTGDGLSAIEVAENVYLPSLTTINAGSFIYGTMAASLTITIPSALMTVNGGNPHPEIQTLIDNYNSWGVPLIIIQV